MCGLRKRRERGEFLYLQNYMMEYNKTIFLKKEKQQGNLNKNKRDT